MIYGSVCSGIEAASCAWHGLGWRGSFLAEVAPFPRAVLAHRWPDIPLHADFTTISEGQFAPIDLLVGGTPCQSFSVAGLRGGLADDRGNLALEFLRLAQRLRPRWLVWENVPGVLSSNDGRDFGAILGGMVELGYGFAYRVLDAQYFGVAQRRRRVFVVGHLGDWRRAAAVLFERQGLRRDPPPRRQARARVAGTLAGGARERGGYSYDDVPLAGSLEASTGGADDNDARAGRLVAFGGNDTRGPIEVATAVRAKGGTGHGDFESETFIAHSLRGEGFDASEDGTGRGTPLVPVAFGSKDHGADAELDLAPTLRAGGHAGSHANAGVPPAIAYSIMSMNSATDYKAREVEVAQPLMAGGPVGGTQGGDFVVHPILEAGARTGVSTTDPRAGMGIGDDGDPSFTLQAGKQHAIAFALRGREEGAQPEAHDDGQSVGALRAASGGSSRDFVAFQGRGSNLDLGQDVTGTLAQNADRASGGAPCVAFNARQDPISEPGLAQPLGAKDNGAGLLQAFGVRRLTPRECERLQGFEDDYTLIPWRGGMAPDGPRYKALGNSMAVPVMRWIGARIAAVDALEALPPPLIARLELVAADPATPVDLGAAPDLFEEEAA